MKHLQAMQNTARHLYRNIIWLELHNLKFLEKY